MGTEKWWNKSVNPIKLKDLGGYYCDPCSPGCANCYASGINVRFGNHIKYGDLCNPEFELDLSVFDRLPKKPCRVFVQSMGDIFHRCVEFSMIGKLYDKLINCSQKKHTMIVLTKRPERMYEFYKWQENDAWFPQCLWLGVTVCIPSETPYIDTLRKIPAAVRFISFEPLLKDVGKLDLTGIGWVIIGTESGNIRRPCDPQWIANIVNQCIEAGVPCYVKQIHDKAGKIVRALEEFPSILQYQQFPGGENGTG